MEKERLEAAAAGHTKYNGKKCNKCGSHERYVSTGTCVACQKNTQNKMRERQKKMLDDARKKGAA